MTITVSLSNIQAARDQLNECEDWILDKTRELAEEIARAGLQIASENLGEYADYIKLDVSAEDTPTGGIAVLTMSDTQQIKRSWYYRGGIKTVDVSPSLLTEFGSGNFAVMPAQSFLSSHITAGRGSFPEQKHAWEDSWSWTGLDKKFHRSSGEHPTRPMYTAYIRLQDAGLIKEIAERVFNG